MSRKIYDKKNPSADGRNYIAYPNNALHYVHHPKMDASKLFLYALIIDYYNAKEGFAFPALDTLALAYGKSEKTTSAHLDDLKAVGLIDFPEKGYYLPMEPLNSSEFYDQFPEAWTEYKRKLAYKDKRKEEARERIRKWRVENGYSENE